MKALIGFAYNIFKFRKIHLSLHVKKPPATLDTTACFALNIKKYLKNQLLNLEIKVLNICN